VQVVEHWNPHAGIRQDLFGVIDIVACGVCVLGVQACVGDSVSARLKKALDEPRLKAWLHAGASFQIWGWRGLADYRKDGERKKHDRWEARIIEVWLDEDGNLCHAEWPCAIPFTGSSPGLPKGFPTRVSLGLPATARYVT
jgi:hypothetical protein